MTNQSNIDEFAQIHLPALNEDEVRNSLIIFIINAALDQPKPSLRYWSLGKAGACAVQSPGWPVVIGNLNQHQCEQLAKQINAVDYPGVLGPEDTAHWFTGVASQSGRKFEPPMHLQMLSISDQPEFPGCEGDALSVSAQHAALYAEWILAFHKETVPHDLQPNRKDLEARATNGNNLLWSVNNKPVSLATIARRTKNAGVINSVYTPSDLRCRGYAGAVTASLVKQIYAEGRSTASLFVDTDDPWASRCYEKIGFHPHCRFNHYLIA